MKPLFTLIFIAVITTACGQSQSPMKVNLDATKKLDGFIRKDKFNAVPNTLFNGLSYPQIKPQLNELVNQAAKDFLLTLNHQPTEKKFQDNIAIGLTRFNKFADHLDTEDRETVCHYFEELMDCVGLQSSNGLLNNWMYGFDPAKKG